MGLDRDAQGSQRFARDDWCCSEFAAGTTGSPGNTAAVLSQDVGGVGLNLNSQ
jgi:hypothetical protein